MRLLILFSVFHRASLSFVQELEPSDPPTVKSAVKACFLRPHSIHISHCFCPTNDPGE